VSSSFISQLAAVGALAPSADNTQCWNMEWTGSALRLRHVARHADINVFDADSHATLLGVGAIAENLEMALAANGVAGAWHWSESGQPYGELRLPQPLPERFVAPAGPAQRHTNRLPYARQPLPEATLAMLEALGEGAARIVVLRTPEQRRRLVRLVRVASEARFCSRALHGWLFGSLRHTPEEVAQGDGLDMATLGLPPGGRGMMAFMSDWKRMQMLNRIGAYKLLALTEVGLLSAAPALVCLVGAGGRRASVDAGRLLNRAWTGLNTSGDAVHPYYVVTDQINRLHAGTLAEGFDARIAAVERELRELLGLGQGEMLHMILRAGLPANTPARSRRLPLEKVFTDASAGPADGR
jgi:hypothetical protein